ncbi:MAG: hypothetical protein L3J30_12700 [Marinosulfonomonas sp.]|nr:hypothetical protein [Marinosulfonomonas sp.]
MMRIIGLTLATALTATTVTGIAALIAKDFDGVFEPFISGTGEANQNAQYPFDDIDTINFFVSSPIINTSLKIMTGAAFSSAKDVMNSNPTNLWCYLNYGESGAIKNRLDLGKKTGGDAPVFTELSGVPDEVFATIGIDRAATARLARSHCKFTNFDPRNTSS